MIQDVSFSPAALSELLRVDVIASAHEVETGFVKQAVIASLRAEPDAGLVHLEILGRRLIFHCTLDGETAHVTDVEVRN